MKKVQTVVLVAGLLLSITAIAEDKKAREVMNKTEPLPRDLEIQLAQSALQFFLQQIPTRSDQTIHLQKQGLHNSLLLFQAWLRSILSTVSEA
jgi:hypothetical protein